MSIRSQNQYSKADSVDSAIDRTPLEIWWDILDQVVYDPFLFSTIYEGGNWTKDARHFLLVGSYEWSEFQRKVIGSVCRSWKFWSQYRRHRRITLNADSPTFDLEAVRALKAQQVTINRSIGDRAISSFPRGVDWEILLVHQRAAAEFFPVPHPRLRRLQLLVTYEHPFDPNSFLEVLGMFNNLTWLDYQVHSCHTRNILIDADRPSVVLPNLQALHYQAREMFMFPFSHIVLPSLRYLSIQGQIPADSVPLVDILLAYGPTIQSVTICPYWISQGTCTIHFPPWDKFPKLEELVLSQHWAIYFGTPSRDHPLQTLIARHVSLDNIGSFLDGFSMRQLVLLRAGWTKSGRLSHEFPIHPIRVDSYINDAKKRGIRLATCWDGPDGTFLNREEALAIYNSDLPEPRSTIPSTITSSTVTPKTGFLNRLFRSRRIHPRF
ncbi:hypothetical protein CPB86DRAFT_256947 [Serendipita vermifera]|nr:hypothetical protein CPB86DRAFT_256947 [Serendipita vermifera]